MARNWGLPTNGERAAFLDAKTAKPLLTLFSSAMFGVIGAAIAVMAFSGARNGPVDLFHGISLLVAIGAAGFGCWAYIWLARPRFAAQFSGEGDAFSKLIRFYARAAVLLILLLTVGYGIGMTAPNLWSGLILCIAGGAGAAAAFQTVVAFVPYYE